MSFFYAVGVNGYLATVLLIFALLSMYALLSSIVFIAKEMIKENDELVRKIVFDSMAMGFVLILMLHLVQMIVRVVYFKHTGQDINLVVTPGLSIHALGEYKMHLESFGVDLGLFAICLFINKLRYRL
ncbi:MULTISPECIES: hypothetical protein [unclassified Enterococcus]|uniref:hypothetical protein n=1 Tax=unclassified Enterococcus TaxID=2608891 RepID=UPI000A34FDDB|nr:MULTISPECIES: hypothetical protein [unclassified Enterococcus]OTO65641.1 hypothetical protein A5865_003705 [Enterococcus sp. 12E11_DIV0728]OUZ13508.1 hypothetical protein A5868_003711 [Enterococcus sp. 12F9_DIV0723]